MNGLVKYEQESESFKDLFDELDERGIISDPDFPLYDTALLEKYGKSFSDNDFKDETGELYYEKVDDFKHWLKIYDDDELTYRVNAQEINIYRAGDFGCIIQTIGKH